MKLLRPAAPKKKWIRLRRRLPQILLCSVVLLAACRQRVETAYDQSASFSKYQSYALDAAPTRLGPWGKRALEETLRAKLAARNFREVSASEADLYVVCTVSTAEKEIASPLGGRVYFPSHFGRYSGWSEIEQTPNVLKNTEGKLVIDFVDSKTLQIVFRGVAEARVRSEEENAAKIETTVTRIVAALPK